MRQVTEKDCAIFQGQAEAFAKMVDGYVSFLSATSADIRIHGGGDHTLCGPATSENWLAMNRRYIRNVKDWRKGEHR